MISSAGNDETFDAETMCEVGVTELAGRPGHVLALAYGRVAVAIREGVHVMVLEPADDTLTRPFQIGR